jgi:uncharacterized delta-60 repeat protein
MQKFYLRLATVLGLMAFQSYCEIRAQTLDPSFAAIDLRQPAIITDALQQPDGKIVAVGTFTQVNGSPATGLARLNADGTLDQAFTTAAASQSFPRKVRCFANGQLLVTGYTLKVGGQSFLTVAKLNADGTVASDFVRSTSELSPSDVIIQPDNKILLCGTFRGPNGLAITGLIRLNADGTVDQAFSAALGAGFLLNGSPVPYLCMALQADGKIIVGGYFQSYQGTARSSLVRLNPDGSLDTTYTPTFKTSRTFPNPSIYAVAIDPRTGYAVVYGEFFGQSQSIVRLDLAGQQDVTFQDVGRPDCHTGNSSLAVDAAGRVLFSSCFNNFNSSVLMRLRADGTEDTQFAVLKQLDERVYVARPLADGTVLIGGGFGRYGTTRNVNLLRLSATGQVVPGFTPALTAPGAIFTLAVQPDGKVVVGGRFSQLNGAPANNLARLTAAGTLDPTFNLTGTDGAVRKVLVQASGRILVAGAFQVAGTHTSPFVARLLAGGTADNAFTSTGSIVNYLSFAGIYGMGVNAISEQPDGSIIAAGSFISFNGFLGTVHRLLTNGSADAAYAGNIGSGTSTSDVYSVASLPDGRHYVGGDFPVFKEVFVENLVRLQANGTRDTGFELATPQPPRYIASLLPLPNGELLIGGQGYKEGNPTVIRVTDLGAVTATPAVGRFGSRNGALRQRPGAAGRGRNRSRCDDASKFGAPQPQCDLRRLVCSYLHR